MLAKSSEFVVVRSTHYHITSVLPRYRALEILGITPLRRQVIGQSKIRGEKFSTIHGGGMAMQFNGSTGGNVLAVKTSEENDARYAV